MSYELIFWIVSLIVASVLFLRWGVKQDQDAYHTFHFGEKEVDDMADL